jgi:hypothetical protein
MGMSMILPSFFSEVLKALPGIKNPFTLAALIGLFIFIIIFSVTARDEISVAHLTVLFLLIASTCGITYALLQGGRKTAAPSPDNN